MEPLAPLEPILLKRYEAGVADARVKSLGEGWYLVETDEGQSLVAIATERDATWVFANGIVARIASVSETRTSSRKRGPQDVMSPMPATVVAFWILARPSPKERQSSSRSMKMEMPPRRRGAAS